MNHEVQIQDTTISDRRGGELSEKGVKRVWMASFKSSPGEDLEECLSLLRDYKVPISEYDGRTRLRQTLMNFYADMMEMY